MTQTNTIQQNLPNSLFPLPVQGGDQGTQGVQNSQSTTTNPNVVGVGQPEFVLNSQGQMVPSTTEDNSPPLPDVGSSQSGDGAQQSVASWLTMPPGSLSQALGLLSDIAAGNMMTMQQIRSQAAKSEYTTQQQSAEATQAQVQGERASAWTKFVGSLVVGGLSITAGVIGGNYSIKSEGKDQAKAAPWNAASQVANTLGNSAVDLVDKTMGGQYEADQAKINKAYLDMLTTIYKSEDEGFNTEAQNAQKSLQNVWDLKRQVADQNSQTIINTASNV